MRINEIASAEDQIALFKLITDKVWQSLAELERAEAETKAKQPMKAKLKASADKNYKPPAPRALPSQTTATAAATKPKPLPTHTQIFYRSPQPIQPRSTKQKPNLNRAKGSNSTNFANFDSNQSMTIRDVEAHS